MRATPFKWSRLIAEITDETFGIPPDVVFQIVENDQLHEIKAHKMILSMVSPTFKTMFYSTCKTSRPWTRTWSWSWRRRRGWALRGCRRQATPVGRRRPWRCGPPWRPAWSGSKVCDIDGVLENKKTQVNDNFKQFSSNKVTLNNADPLVKVLDEMYDECEVCGSRSDVWHNKAVRS